MYLVVFLFLLFMRTIVQIPSHATTSSEIEKSHEKLVHKNKNASLEKHHPIVQVLNEADDQHFYLLLNGKPFLKVLFSSP